MEQEFITGEIDMCDRCARGNALLIGVGDPLTTADDALGLANMLIDRTRCAYPADQVRVLTGERADREGMLSGLDWLAAQTEGDPEATAIVSFSGHATDSDEGYLIPFGCDLDDLARTAVSSVEFNEKLRAIQAKKVLVLLDCCHSGGIAEAKGLRLDRSPISPGLCDELKSGSSWVILASSRKDEISHTGYPYSVFTSALIEGLAGYGSFENDGYARVLDVALWVGRKVTERTGERQHPIIEVTDLENNFPLAYYAGGEKEPKLLEWTQAVPGFSSGLDKEQRKAGLRKLRGLRRNLLFIEERMSHYVEFTAIPLPLVRSKWCVQRRIAELENELGLSDRGGGP